MILLVSVSHATSCGPNVAMEPPDGATNLPVNARPFVNNEGIYLEPDPVLMDGSGAIVATVREGKRLVPVAPLEPEATWVIDGGSLEAGFTTGTHTDLDAPEPPVFLGHVWTSISNWEHGEILDFANSSEPAVLELALTVLATGETFGPTEVASPFIGWLVCGMGFGPQFGPQFPGAPTQVHLVARWVDLAGNRSEPIAVDFMLAEDVPFPDTGVHDADPTPQSPPDPIEPVDPVALERACGCGSQPASGSAAMVLIGLLGWRRPARLRR